MKSGDIIKGQVEIRVATGEILRARLPRDKEHPDATSLEERIQTEKSRPKLALKGSLRNGVAHWPAVLESYSVGLRVSLAA